VFAAGGKEGGEFSARAQGLAATKAQVVPHNDQPAR